LSAVTFEAEETHELLLASSAKRGRSAGFAGEAASALAAIIKGNIMRAVIFVE